MKWGLSNDPFFQPPAAADAPVMYPELEEQPEFDSVRRICFEIPRQHTIESYVGWLKTDSLILSLDNEARRGFLSDIATLIDRKYCGAVSRNLVYEEIMGLHASQPDTTAP
jgi:hypothetical protein